MHANGSTCTPNVCQSGVRFTYGLLRALNVDKAFVMGHSAGAGVAVDFAIAHPGSVSGLILAAPFLPTDEKGFLARLDAGQLLRWVMTCYFEFWFWFMGSWLNCAVKLQCY